MFKKLLVAISIMTLAVSASAANRPSGYKTICKSNKTCSVGSSTNVAFGASGKFTYKVLSGTFKCNVSTFGKDPISSKKNKECSISKKGSSDTGASKSSSNSSSSSGKCASGNGAKVCLEAKGTGSGVELKWSVSGKVKNMQVYRNTKSKPSGRKRLSKVGSKRSYTDKKASSGKTYYYWIKFKAGSKTYNAGPISGKKGSGNSSSNSSSNNDRKNNDKKKDKQVTTSSSGACKAGATISGKTVDCGGKTIGLSCKGDSEKQPPVLTLKNATVKNVRISKSGGSDGIHCTGNCTIQNAVWEDICEDAATLKKGTDGKTMTIIGGSAYNAKSGYGGKPDKVFQHNSKNSTTVVKGGFTLTGEHGKLWRSCGNCTGNGGPRKIKIDGVKINAKIGSIVGVNGNFGDKATIRNLKIKNYKSGSPKVCVEYKGVQKGKGESKKIGEKWNTSACDVKKSDVSKL